MQAAYVLDAYMIPKNTAYSVLMVTIRGIGREK